MSRNTIVLSLQDLRRLSATAVQGSKRKDKTEVGRPPAFRYPTSVRNRQVIDGLLSRILFVVSSSLLIVVVSARTQEHAQTQWKVF